MSKKGQTTEIISIIVVFIAFTMIAVVGLRIYQDWNAKRDMGDAAQGIFDDAIKMFASFDTVGIIIIGGLFASMIVSGFYVRTHPVFFVISLLSFSFTLMVVPQLSNMLTTFMEHENLSVAAASFTVLAYLRDILPTIAVVGGIVFFIALYAKRASPPVGGGGAYGF